MTIERNRYFTGQLLGEADLTQEQLYFREKARRHNRMLHGWGIVSGLGVGAGAASSNLTVEPGYALDPWGDEIIVLDPVIVDLLTEDEGGNAVHNLTSMDANESARDGRPDSPSTSPSVTRSARVGLSLSASPWSTAELVKASPSSS